MLSMKFTFISTGGQVYDVWARSYSEACKKFVDFLAKYGMIKVLRPEETD